MPALARRRILHRADGDLGGPPLLWRALESLGGAVIVVDAGLRVLGATRLVARVLGAPVSVGAHVVRVLSGGSEALVADAFTSDHATLTTIATGDPRHEGRARLRVTPIRDPGSELLGWIVRLTEEPTPRGTAQQFETLWTQDEATKRVLAMAELVASCEASVLVTGEMGVGKSSLVAAIHARSARRRQPLRVLACAAMTPRVLERQIVGQSPADLTCTLLLDEIADLPHDAQGLLLRVLETRLVTPIDGGPPIPVDVRTFATSSRPLDREVEAGHLRPDLLVHVRTVSLELPPLRARVLDVPLLADKIMAELAPRTGHATLTLADDALAKLRAYAWPGNVRELRAALEAAIATGRGPLVTAADLPAWVTASGERLRELPSVGPSAPIAAFDERARLRRALERAGGDRARAAAMLGMSRSTLWRRMRKHGLADG